MLHVCVVSVPCLESGLKTLSFREPNCNVFAWGEQATSSSLEKGESFTIGFVCGQSFKREVVDLGLLRMFEWTASVGIVRSELGPQILRCSFCPSCIPLIGTLLRLFVALSLHAMMKIVKSRLRILVRLRSFVHCILSLHAMLKSVKSQQLILRISLLSTQPWL